MNELYLILGGTIVFTIGVFFYIKLINKKPTGVVYNQNKSFKKNTQKNISINKNNKELDEASDFLFLCLVDKELNHKD